MLGLAKNCFCINALLLTCMCITCCWQVGATVEVKLPDSGEYTAAVVQKINDMSMYTVGMFHFLLHLLCFV